MGSQSITWRAENLEAIEFLRNTNRILEQTPGAVTMAEESTDLPGDPSARPAAASVSGSNGTSADARHLDYMKLDPVHRRYHSATNDLGMPLPTTPRILCCRSPTMKWCTAKIDSRPHAGRCLAEVRQPARLLRLAIAFAFPGEKAAVYGQ